MTHGELVNKVLVTFGARQEARLWKQVTGVFEAPNGAKVRVGLKGCADITGVRNDGKRLEIECKVGHDTQKEQQKKFETMIQWMNGKYMLVRETDDLEKVWERIMA